MKTKENTNSKLKLKDIVGGFIMFAGLIVLYSMVSGCSIFKSSERYEMKKSPCACLKIESNTNKG